MRKLYPCLRALWRLGLGRCPLCNSRPPLFYGCYVCCSDLIAEQFRWGRWHEETRTADVTD